MIEIKHTHPGNATDSVRVQSEVLKAAVSLTLRSSGSEVTVLLDPHKARSLAAILNGYAEKVEAQA